MGRPPRFDNDDILNAALAVVAERWRYATVEEVAARLGTRVGSIYYRFPTRESLFVALWVRSIRRFQVAFMDALENPDAEQALLAAACRVPDYCRANPEEAIALTLYRYHALVADCPQDQREDVVSLNDSAEMALMATGRRFGAADADLVKVRTAVQQLPYGMIRPYLGASEPIPDWITPATRAASAAVLALIPRG